MINGLEGIPGSGKSYEACVYHVLPALKAGRKVITNLPLVVDVFAAIDPDYRDLIELRRRPAPVRGTWDANRIDDDGNGNAFELFEDGHTEPAGPEVMLFGHIWDFWSEWKHPKTGHGPLFIVDECHVAMPKLGTDKQLIEWFKLHRHFNADVLLATQRFRDTCEPIAGLMAMLVKVRKADILGKADHYIRKVHGGYRGAVISTEQRKYKPEFFALYKSHTQGNSVMEAAAGDVAPGIVKFRRFSRIFWVITIVYVVWAFWPAGDEAEPTPQKTVKPAAVVQAPQGATTVQLDIPAPGGQEPSDKAAAVIAKGLTPAPATSGPQSRQQAVEMPDDEHPEPYASKLLHLTGVLKARGATLYTFAISDGGRRIADVDSAQLRAMGYKFDGLTDCAGTLRWKGKARAITCDAPQLASAGSDRLPLVLEVPHGGGSPTGSSRPIVADVPAMPRPDSLTVRDVSRLFPERS